MAFRRPPPPEGQERDAVISRFQLRPQGQNCGNPFFSIALRLLHLPLPIAAASLSGMDFDMGVGTTICTLVATCTLSKEVRAKLHDDVIPMLSPRLQKPYDRPTELLIAAVAHFGRY